MHKKLLTKVKGLNNKQRTIFIGVVIIAIALAVLCVTTLSQPKPSVVVYCKVYKEEKTRLSKLPGDTWPTAVFDDKVGDAGELAAAFGRLARVAPSDVKSDVEVLQKLYQKVNDDPSQALSVSLSGIGPENNVKAWTDTRCVGSHD